MDRHRDQRVGDALTRGEQHVHLARRRRGAHLLGKVEEFVGGVTHRGDDDDDVVARLLGLDDALSHPADAFGGRHRRSSVLLNDESHAVSLLSLVSSFLKIDERATVRTVVRPVQG